MPAGSPDVLALPKGIIDEGERAAETAVREVWEEAGLRCRDLGRLGDVRYVYTRAGQRIFKIVVFHLMRATAGRIGEIDPAMRREVAAARWIPLEEGPARLSYRGERQMAALAAERVQAL
jgi:8-oxo-dGTP pyrophosphatase MutT (NUDIX family)